MGVEKDRPKTVDTTTGVLAPQTHGPRPITPLPFPPEDTTSSGVRQHDIASVICSSRLPPEKGNHGDAEEEEENGGGRVVVVVVGVHDRGDLLLHPSRSRIASSSSSSSVAVYVFLFFPPLGSSSFASSARGRWCGEGRPPALLPPVVVVVEVVVVVNVSHCRGIIAYASGSQPITPPPATTPLPPPPLTLLPIPIPLAESCFTPAVGTNEEGGGTHERGTTPHRESSHEGWGEGTLVFLSPREPVAAAARYPDHARVVGTPEKEAERPARIDDEDEKKNREVGGSCKNRAHVEEGGKRECTTANS